MTGIVRGVAVAALAIALCGASAQTDLPAQAGGAATTAIEKAGANAPAGISCLRRQAKPIEGASVPFVAFVAFAPTGDAAKLTAKGLAASRCKVPPRVVADYQKMVCGMVTQGNEAVQNRLEQVLGAQPRDLCAAARKAAPLLGVAAMADPEAMSPPMALPDVVRATNPGAKADGKP